MNTRQSERESVSEREEEEEEEGDVPFCDALIGRQAVLQVRPRRDVTAESVLEVSVAQTIGFPPRDQRCDDVLQMDLQEEHRV